MSGIHVICDAKYFLSFFKFSQVITSNTKVEVREASLKILRTHKEHDSGIFPFTLLDVEIPSSLKHKLVRNFLLGQVCSSYCFHICLECCFVRFLLVQLEVSMSNLNIALKPCWSHLYHSLQICYCSIWLSFLNFNTCKTSKIVKVILVFNLLDAALCKLC